MIFREKVLSWLAEQEEQQAVPTALVEPVKPTPAAGEKTESDSHRELAPSPPAPSDGNHCPNCDSSLWRPFCCGMRCGQCGLQQNAAQPVGASRRDYEAGLYAGKRAVMNSRAFMQARGRLLGR